MTKRFNKFKGEVLHIRGDVQMVCGQLKALFFKFSTLMAKLQQQKGQASVSPMVQNCGDQEAGQGQSAMNMKPIRIDVPRYIGDDP